MTWLATPWPVWYGCDIADYFVTSVIYLVSPWPLWHGWQLFNHSYHCDIVINNGIIIQKAAFFKKPFPPLRVLRRGRDSQWHGSASVYFDPLGQGSGRDSTWQGHFSTRTARTSLLSVQFALNSATRLYVQDKCCAGRFALLKLVWHQLSDYSAAIVLYLCVFMTSSVLIGLLV